MNIIHLSTDNIFLDNALEQFEAIKGTENRVIVFSNSKKLKFIKGSYPTMIISHQIKVNDILGDISEANLIVLHGLFKKSCEIIIALKSRNLKICWVLHGHEVYSTNMFKPKEIFSKRTLSKHILFFLLFETRRLLSKLAGNLYPTQSKLVYKVAKRVDFLAITWYDEFEHIKKKLKMNADYLKFSYYPLNKITFPVKQVVNSKSALKIMVGNSATLTNNHYDVFQILSNKREGFEIYAPLSYGDESYKKKLIKTGIKTFQNKFKPMTRFIPLNEYYHILSKMDICIMNHYRQQAFGTILSLIYLGVKVFLSERNTIFQFLKGERFHIYCVEKDLMSADWSKKMTTEQKVDNKFKMEEIIGEQKLTESLNFFFKNLNLYEK